MFFPDKNDLKSTTHDIVHNLVPDAPIVELEVTRGRSIGAKLVSVPIDSLRLNSNNPRLRLPSTQFDELELEEWLWREEGTRSLYNEIRYSGGLSDKPIIDSDLVVLEGNRRTVCLKRLNEQAQNGELPEFRTDHFSNVQCLMLPEDTHPKDLDLLLARSHVSGKKEWAPLNQAWQIHTIVQSHSMSVREISMALSLNPRTIETMLKALGATEEYGRLYSNKDSKWMHKFSYFYELFRSRQLEDWAGLRRNQKLFMRLLVGPDPKLTRGSQVRDLPSILMSEKVFKVLRTKGFSEAIKLVSVRKPRPAPLAKLLSETVVALRKVARNRQREIDPNNIRIIGQIRKETDSLLARNQKALLR